MKLKRWQPQYRRRKCKEFTVPEERSHMILPEIEEEEELPEEKKVSLTSLLLGQPGGSEYASPMSGYDRSPAVTHRVGALRSNGHPPSGSWRDLLALGALDGVKAWESEESEMSAGEETMRRGSLPTIVSSTRRGSRLQDILRYNQERKKKRDGKYKRDSQGFVWKRMPAMVYEEYTPPAADTKPAAVLPPSPLITAAVTPEQLAALAAAIAAESSRGGVALPLPGGGLAQAVHPTTAAAATSKPTCA